MNPCPCGFLSHPVRPCVCSPHMVSRYQKRISGPLMDRIDIFIEAPPVEYEKLVDSGKGETSEQVQLRVEAARTPPAGTVRRHNLSVQFRHWTGRYLEVLPDGRTRQGPVAESHEPVEPFGAGLSTRCSSCPGPSPTCKAPTRLPSNTSPRRSSIGTEELPK